mgnify:CR=1 FL=1|jgi:hypothetical protein
MATTWTRKDAHENVIVNASGLAVVEELSMRCAAQRLVSEECLPLAVHPRSRPEGRRTESCHPVSRSHCLILGASTGTASRPTRQVPAREPASHSQLKVIHREPRRKNKTGNSVL